jgi:ABC-type glycerol-3-phosphate transport system substrate-binding protein
MEPGMNRHTQRRSLLAAVIGIFVVAGCSFKKSESEAPALSSEASPGAEAEHDEAVEAVAAAGTVGAIWTQIGDEQSKLSSAIQSGQLKDVHHLAFGIRDLVVALAEKATAASPAIAPQLNGMVEQVKASASKLDELGDAGNLSGVQAEYAKLEAVLGAIRNVAGGK